MRDRLSFLPDVTAEERILLSKILDWIDDARERYRTHFSFFLNERECSLCERVMASERWESFELRGGYSEAQRRMLCVYPPYCEPEEGEFPFGCVSFRFRTEDKLTHRDFLGSLMALQIKRECVGDILVSEGRAAVFVTGAVLPEVMGITKVGRVGVRTEEGRGDVPVPEQRLKELSGTVASLRFDCVASLGIRLSREKTAALIRSGAAEIDHVCVDQPGRTVAEGSVFSLRGYGKFLLRSVDGQSNKGRIHITVCKYI